MREGEGATGPRPVSAKSVYRLADKLDLPALKMRAFQHICSQLTSLNIPAEVFSRFSSTFDDVRKVSCGAAYQLTSAGPGRVFPAALGRDQEVGHDAEHLEADPRRQARRLRGG